MRLKGVLTTLVCMSLTLVACGSNKDDASGAASSGAAATVHRADRVRGVVAHRRLHADRLGLRGIESGHEGDVQLRILGRPGRVDRVRGDRGCVRFGKRNVHGRGEQQGRHLGPGRLRAEQARRDHADGQPGRRREPAGSRQTGRPGRARGRRGTRGRLRSSGPRKPRASRRRSSRTSSRTRKTTRPSSRRSPLGRRTPPSSTSPT